MDRCIYVLGEGPRVFYSTEALRAAGRTVRRNFTEVSEPAVWMLPFPLTAGQQGLLHRLPRGVGGYVMGGGLSAAAQQRLSSGGFCFYNCADEEFLQENARLTAEGAIMTALALLPCSLRHAGILVVGYGRIGQALCRALRGFGADVTVSARRQTQLSLIEHAGFRSAVTGQWGPELGKYRLVFQTVPAVVFSDEQAALLAENCLVLELASPPYGMAPETARMLGSRYLIASGLPGKTAPESAGTLWGQAVGRMLEEKGL